jgi:hypothetical protein
MITRDSGAAERARITGSLIDDDALQILVDAVDGGVTVLDLAEVVQVDDSAVRMLASLEAERCTLIHAPRWLELWLARVRDKADV